MVSKVAGLTGPHEKGVNGKQATSTVRDSQDLICKNCRRPGHFARDCPSAAKCNNCNLPGLFYGPQGPYSLFAGRDATWALALMSFDPNDLTGDLEGLSPDELEVLQDWEEKFKERYPRVGHLATDSDPKAAAPLDHEGGSS